MTIDFAPIKGKQYAIAAMIITELNPSSTDTMVARAVLITDVQPLIPHAHGICASCILETINKPEGKGMPMRKAGGATRRSRRKILKTRE